MTIANQTAVGVESRAADAAWLEQATRIYSAYFATILTVAGDNAAAMRANDACIRGLELLRAAQHDRPTGDG